MTDNKELPCGLGPCAAMEGHEGTCAQASGWDKFTEDAKDAAYEAGLEAGRTDSEFRWAVENRVVKSPILALFRDEEDALDYVAGSIDLRVIRHGRKNGETP